MLLDFSTTFAWRCPFCGELELNEINIFYFSGTDKLEIKCGCDFTKLVVIKNNSKRYQLKYNCIICESEHRVFYKQSELWSNQVKKIKCVDNGAELGYLGPYTEVKKLADLEEEYLELMMDKLEFEDYFSNPEVMLSVLNILHDIAENSGLTCQCGNDDIEIEMLPGKVKLTCHQCYGAITINAETKDDLLFLKKLRKVKILEGVVSALERTN
ncbi:hypothetical protein MWH28_03430 [Natroniella sulfidigena]|uniref:hypothetical protein n=1 Tax=Natroniella sulfidigena TaxID=723921 RepID=UPI00200A7F7F|nr:hypothetical protein [Natroniella sulfidigena]MCK8816417.1 hypothetical protein [Natroniella sulfidigena]